MRQMMIFPCPRGGEPGQNRLQSVKVSVQIEEGR